MSLYLVRHYLSSVLQYLINQKADVAFEVPNMVIGNSSVWLNSNQNMKSFTTAEEHIKNSEIARKKKKKEKIVVKCGKYSHAKFANFVIGRPLKVVNLHKNCSYIKTRN